MKLEFHAPRCPICDEQMVWVRTNGEMHTVCKWCIAYGRPDD